MIFADTVLFSLFCYKFYTIVCLLNAQENVPKIPANAWNAFMIQFICVSMAMLMCVADAFVHYFFIGRDMKLFFVLNVIVVSLCNMAMLKETHQAMIKVIRCHCSLKKHHAQKVKQSATMIHMAKMHAQETIAEELSGG